MKKRLILVVLALSITVLFSSCLNLMLAITDPPKTYEINLNEYNPFEKNVTVTYKGSLMLKRWNSSDTMEIMYGNRNISFDDKVILTMPSGNNSLIFDVYIVEGDTSYRAPNVELQYLMEDGKKYQLKTRSKKVKKVYEFYIGIYDVTKKSELLKEWKIGEYE